MQTASLSIFQFVLSLPKSRSKVIQFHRTYFHPMNTDFCTATARQMTHTLGTFLLVGVKDFAKHINGSNWKTISLFCMSYSSPNTFL